MRFDHIAYIGFGANLGDREKNCREGMERLDRSGFCKVVAVSPLYMTEPVDYLDQDWFVNGAAKVATAMQPAGLLSLLKHIETEVGRTPGGPRFGPRVLDMDVLLFDDLVAEGPELILPHPRMHKRRFVLAPLCDIAQDIQHPVLHKTMRELLSALDEEGQKVVAFP
ncbi:MAG: 2-amino-4-hydroxy-6-hydroxymethyldihydropteridine diphosphokinase [Thermodesulfobacteriota bacterium]